MNIVEIAVKRPVAVAMFTFAILLFGMVSLGRLSVNLLPDLSYPTLTIRADYPGAAPGEVEQLVSKPIEEAIGVVKGVRTVTSTSRPGQSDVVLEFAWGTDMDFASLEVREKLDILQLPLDVKKPRLLRFNPSLDPILRLGLSHQSENSANNDTVEDMKRLRVYADEQIKRRLESIEGVASVRIGGGLENEIQILIDQNKASQLNIKLATVIDRLKSENVNTSGGRINEGSQAYLVRTLNQFDDLEQIRNMYVGRFEGKNIQLKDIAQITNAHKERNAITRFNGIEGTEIAIYKEGDANAVNVAEKVKQQLASVRQNLPSQYQLDLVYDQSVFIKNAIDDVLSAALIGGLLAMLVLYLFLRDFWTTVIISVSIPVSIVATFNLMYGNDISLNIMSLGGIALAVGLLVDNSIVVLENIDRHRKRQPNQSDARLAAVQGSKEVAGAIIASTLTTMAVFIPLVFVEGIAGQLFRDQALTVSFALLASLIVALTLIPTLASRSKRSGLEHEEVFSQPKTNMPASLPARIFYWVTFPVRMIMRAVFVYLPAAAMTLAIGFWRIAAKGLYWLFYPLTIVFSALMSALEKGYEKVLCAALSFRIAVLGAIIAVSSGALLLVPKLGMELIPQMSQGEFHVEVNLPAGAKVEQTDTLLAELAELANRQPGVQRSYSLAGTGSLISAAPSQGGDHWGKLNVVMEPDASTEQTEAARAALRQYLATRAGVESQFGEPELFSFDAPIQIEIRGYDLNQLQLASLRITEAMEKQPRFADINSTLRPGNPEIKIEFNHARLSRLELDAPTVSQLIAAKIGGKVATQYSLEDRKVDILVRTQQQQRDDIRDVQAIVVNPGSQHPIPLGSVADVYMSTGPGEITRLGQQRVAIIQANLTFGDLAQGVTAAQSIIDSVSLPLQIQAEIAGQSEDMQQSFRSLMFALAMAVFLVYLVMASQFESLLHPLLILFAVPLAGAGSVYGLFFTGTHVSVVVFIGLIMLSGIVVNNAIVLVDRINQLRHQGMDKHSAIIDAGKSRLRPIVMTSLTTILGLLPMAVGIGNGAEVRTPMAITVIFGLLFASLLTLVLLPVLYSLFDRKHFEKETAIIPQGETTYG
ncbi:AcrB/AcrD/AcrF family protein [Alteromonas aestuariivivens]|uniref:AcrB/AcrD/AcrF family protein n=1 Tax=Alteromonas aestuariivivens TaxID=1938339 RepID=A0A3D8MAU7_9ALTE|nr:efflux RND transporter permease subunit [Alteromonas aestuariivivens]RDV27402.1 AcrB/AcrD/AcrF family protein [Alteromonas aestuariivivens]